MADELKNNARELTQDEIRSALADTKTIADARAGLFRQKKNEFNYDLGKILFLCEPSPSCANLYSLANSICWRARALLNSSQIIDYMGGAHARYRGARQI
jgi:hypothetical protein